MSEHFQHIYARNPENATLITEALVDGLNEHTQKGEFGAIVKYAKERDDGKIFVSSSIKEPPKVKMHDLLSEDPYTQTFQDAYVNWEMVVFDKNFNLIHENLSSYWEWDDVLIPISVYATEKILQEEVAKLSEADFIKHKKTAIENYSQLVQNQAEFKQVVQVDKAIVFCSQYGHVYGHFIEDYFARLSYMLMQLSPQERKTYKIILPPEKNYYSFDGRTSHLNYIIPCLVSLGVTEDQCVFAHPDCLLQVTELLLPSPFRNHPETRRALGHLVGFYSDGNTYPDMKRLYLSRAKAMHRRLVNEHDVVRALMEEAFTPLIIERFSFKEQMNILRNVETLVAQDSSTLANTLLCRNAKNYLALTCEKTMSPFYSTLVEAKSYFQFCDPENPSDYNWYDSNIMADVDKLRKNIAIMDEDGFGEAMVAV